STWTLSVIDSYTNHSYGSGTVEGQRGVSVDAGFGGGNNNLLISGAAQRIVTLPVCAGLLPLTVNAPNATVTASGTGVFTFNTPVTLESGSFRSEERRVGKERSSRRSAGN